MLRGRHPAASAAVASLRGGEALDPPTADTLRRAAAAKQFIEALAAEQQGRVAAARAARSAAAETAASSQPPSAAAAAAHPPTAPPTSSRRSGARRPSPSDYTSLALIGRGAFGEVRLARERSTGALVAVKALDKGEMRARGQVAHVRSERDALAASPLRACPFIVKLRATFQDEARLFLVMDYCPGGDLLTLLQRVDTLPPAAVRFYGAQLATAVGAIHAAGYVHRDIKPDNVLLDAGGRVKLSDFGLCTAVEWREEAAGSSGGAEAAAGASPATATTTTTTTHRRAAAFSTVGTPDYIAPEVLLRSPGGYGPAADWWSVGAVLYEALAGHPPFAAPTPAETVRRAVAWRETLVLPDPAVVGPDAVDLLARLLCDAPDRLGAGPRGAEEVMGHPFFAGVDWGTLASAAPPHVPALSGPADVSHFDDFSSVDDGGVGLGMHVDGAAHADERRDEGHPSPAAPGSAAPDPSHPPAGADGRGRRWKRADADFVGYTFRGTLGP